MEEPAISHKQWVCLFGDEIARQVGDWLGCTPVPSTSSCGCTRPKKIDAKNLLKSREALSLS